MATLEIDGGKIKPSGYKQEYTLEQAKELARCTVDPVYFIETYVKLKHPKHGALPFVMYEFQKRLIQTYMGNRKNIAMLSRQCGKALPLDTRIPTPTGWTTMGAINPGDYVLGDDGRPVLVSFATDTMVNHDCYTIGFDNGESITADAEHLWTVSSNIYKHVDQTVTTVELIAMLEKHQNQGQGLYVRVAEPLVLSEQSLSVDPYVLGVWLGDGGKNDGRFTSHIDDVAEITDYITQRGYTVATPAPDKRRPTTVSQTIYDLRPKLRDLGVLRHKHIPLEYLRGSIQQRLDLLRGLMDTDGHARPRGACEFYQKDRVLIDQVYELIVSLGIKARIREKFVNGEIYHTISFSTTKHVVFNLDRKRAIQLLCKGHPKNSRHYIQSIIKTDSVPVRCIRVENSSHLFLCGRSMIPTHNTATAAAYLLWWCIFKDNQFVLVASKDQGGADEIMERLWYAYEELPWFLKPGVKKNDVKTKMFDNGSKIITKATTPTAGRGLSVSLLYLDEFAFVRSNWAEKFWTSISPTLATGGSCIITSTPSTDEDKFAKIWFNATPSPLSDKWEDKLAKRYKTGNEEEEDAYETIFETTEIAEKMEMLSALILDDDEEEEEDGFVSFHAHWTSVPDQLDKNGNILSYRGEKFKRSQIKSGVTNDDWMREFECCFISGENTLISGAKLAVFRATVREPRFVDKWGCRWYEPIQPSTPYAVILDPSGDGTNGDDAAIQVWELPTMRQVAEWNDAESDQDEQARMLYRVLNRVYKLQNNHPEHDGVNNIYYSVERNAIGIGIIRAIEHIGEDKFPGWLIDSSEVSRTPRGETMRAANVSRYRGLLTTPSTKKRYAQDLKQFIERNLFTVRSKFLSSQLKNFVKTGPGWAAKNGKDDVVMSCVLMCHLIDELRYQEPELDDYVRPVFEDYDENDPDHPDNVPMIPMM